MSLLPAGRALPAEAVFVTFSACSFKKSPPRTQQFTMAPYWKHAAACAAAALSPSSVLGFVTPAPAGLSGPPASLRMAEAAVAEDEVITSDNIR